MILPNVTTCSCSMERHGQSPLQHKSSKSSLQAVSFQEFPGTRTSYYSTAHRAPTTDTHFTKPFKTKKWEGCRDLKEKEPKRWKAVKTEGD